MVKIFGNILIGLIALVVIMLSLSALGAILSIIQGIPFSMTEIFRIARCGKYLVG